MDYTKAKAAYHAEIRRLAQLAHNRYCINLNNRLYLMGKMNKEGIWTALSIEWDGADGWTPLRPEHLPRNQTVDHLASTIEDILKREPLWLFAIVEPAQPK
jgi:hypothetical protein